MARRVHSREDQAAWGIKVATTRQAEGTKATDCRTIGTTNPKLAVPLQPPSPTKCPPPPLELFVFPRPKPPTTVRDCSALQTHGGDIQARLVTVHYGALNTAVPIPVLSE